MLTQTFKLYAHRSIAAHNHGQVQIFPFPADPKSEYAPALNAGEFEITLDILPEDNGQAEIEALEARLQTERAESQSRQNILLDRISKLKAIGHDAPADDGIVFEHPIAYRS